jgi:hypothetical protein
MKSAKALHIALLAAGLVFAGQCPAATLTGASWFDTDATGNAGSQLWNSLGSDAFPNLYLVVPPVNAFVNTGNSAGARINVPIVANVSYVFMYWAQPGPTGAGSEFGLNLFFDGDDVTPRISVFAPLFGPFSVNSSPNTRSLGGTTIAAAGTANFTDGDLAMTLANFTALASLTDAVQSFDNIPGGGPDFTGFITLSATAVPEPASTTEIGTALAILALACLRRCAVHGRSVTSAE